MGLDARVPDQIKCTSKPQPDPFVQPSLSSAFEHSRAPVFSHRAFASEKGASLQLPLMTDCAHTSQFFLFFQPFLWMSEQHRTSLRSYTFATKSSSLHSFGFPHAVWYLALSVTSLVGGVVGSLVGDAVGSSVGDSVGSTAGSSVGDAVGSPVGDSVGPVVGGSVGGELGVLDGGSVEEVLGVSDGDSVGDALGLMLSVTGLVVGGVVGGQLGSEDGAFVGFLLASSVGAPAEADVGIDDGASEGAADAGAETHVASAYTAPASAAHPASLASKNPMSVQAGLTEFISPLHK